MMLLSFMFFGHLCYAQDEGPLELTSPDFGHGDMIPAEFSCEGSDVNPTLNIMGVPEEALTLALIVDDPDAPAGTWVHWIVFNVLADWETIEGNTIPGMQGLNDFGKENYGGPCPPDGEHRYFFKLYALDTVLNLESGITKEELETAMEGHILEQTELIGLYTQ